MKIRIDLTFLFIVFAICSTLAQNSAKENQHLLIQNYDQATLTLSNFFTSGLNKLKLDSNASFKINNEGNIGDGKKFTRFHHFHKGIRVIGSQLILHSNKSTGSVTKAIGAPSKVEINTTPVLSAFRAEAIAQDVKLPFHLTTENDEEANWNVEKIELVIIDKHYPETTENLALAYAVEISDLDYSIPLYETVYINANTGKYITHFTSVMTDQITGIANTQYYGTQEITIDSISPDQYEMIDTTRGNGVITRDALSGQIVSDEDNIWNGPGDETFTPAGDAHYCTQSFYDFLLDQLDWNGIDGNEKAMVSQVNYGGKYNNNAFWLGGSNDFVALGNGNCHQHSAFTTLDIVGHEFTHGIIEATSQLIYKNESGAINESIADILGKSLEYTYDPLNFNWNVGDKIRRNDGVAIIRSMEDPNLAKDPKFYGGLHWQTSTSDQGGVHTNSGVMNHWFYLLVEGGQGINEVDYSYNVSPIGLDKALQMVFDLNVGYFGPSTTYFDAFYLSLDYAETEFGPLTPEYASVVEAWKTVGLFQGIEARDLIVKSQYPTYNICPNELVFMEVYVINNGSEQFTNGEEVQLSFKQRNATKWTEIVTLPQDLLPGDTLPYKFLEPLQDSSMHNGTIELSIEGNENVKFNNQSTASSRNSDTNDFDIKLSSFSFNTGNICNNAEAASFRYNYTNNGCQPILQGDTILIEITTPQETFIFEDTVKIFPQIEPGTFVSSTLVLDTPLELDFETYTIKVIYVDDAIDTNNSRSYNLVKIQQTEIDYLETYESTVAPNYTLKTTSVYVRDSIFEYQGNKMLALAGLRANPFFENCPDIENYFEEYNFESVLTFCLNGMDMIEPVFDFDLIQLTNADYDDQPLLETFGCVVQVVTDSLTYPLIYGLPEGQSEKMKFELPQDYVGQLAISVITNSGKSQPFLDGELDEVDAALFDNFRFFDQTIQATEDEAYTNTPFKIYPNPSSSNVTVEYGNNIDPFEIAITNATGQTVYQVFNVQTAHRINTKDWPRGVYYASMKTDDQKRDVQKIIIL